MDEPCRSTNRDVWHRVTVKPMLRMKLANLRYQARGACFSPYNDFDRRQTASGRAGLTKPAGC
jgi:hypothetical protein